MKFNIHIPQEKLIEIEPRARLLEGAIIDYLYWLCNSASENIEGMRITGPDGQRYTWVNYDWVLLGMPLLKGKAKSTLTPVFKKLEEWGFIASIIHKGKNGGDRKYVRILPKTDILFSKLNDLVRKSERPRSEIRTNYYINNIKNKKAGYKNNGERGREGMTAIGKGITLRRKK